MSKAEGTALLKMYRSTLGWKCTWPGAQLRSTVPHAARQRISQRDTSFWMNSPRSIRSEVKYKLEGKMGDWKVIKFRYRISETGEPTRKLGRKPIFWPNFAETAWKWRKLDRWGTSKMLLCRSATYSELQPVDSVKVKIVQQRIRELPWNVFKKRCHLKAPWLCMVQHLGLKSWLTAPQVSGFKLLFPIIFWIGDLKLMLCLIPKIRNEVWGKPW